MKTHVRRMVLVVAALVAVTAFGCSKDGGGSGGGAGAASAKGALGMLPKDVDIVMGVDFASLRSSALYKKYAPMLMAAVGDKLAKFKDACGFDPVEAAGSLTAGVKGDKGDQDVTMIVTGFKKDQVVDCMKKAAEKEGKSGDLKIDGDYVELNTPKGAMGMLFVGDTLLVHKTATAFFTKDQLIAQSKQAADASPAGSKAFMDVYDKVDTKSALWFIVNGSAPSMKNSPVQAKIAFGSIKVTDGLAADITARMNNEADAKQVGDMAKSQLDQVKGAGMIDEASADVSGSDVHIKASMSQAQLEMIASMAKGAMGAFGRGAAGGGGDPGAP